MKEVDETRKPCTLVVIGHVQAGKSTLSGNILWALDLVNKNTINSNKEEARRNKRESTWLAYIMDTN